jgi:hypothetical protein
MIIVLVGRKIIYTKVDRFLSDETKSNFKESKKNCWMIKKCNKRIDMVVKLIFILIFVKQMRDIFTLIILK